MYPPLTFFCVSSLFLLCPTKGQLPFRPKSHAATQFGAANGSAYPRDARVRGDPKGNFVKRSFQTAGCPNWKGWKGCKHSHCLTVRDVDFCHCWCGVDEFRWKWMGTWVLNWEGVTMAIKQRLEGKGFSFASNASAAKAMFFPWTLDNTSLSLSI